MRAAAAQALEDFDYEDLILDAWREGVDTIDIAKSIQVAIHMSDDESTIPTISQAQAHAYGVIARRQDALYALRQQEAQRA